MENAKLEKLNEITNHAITYSWLGFIALAAYVGKRLVDFIFQSVIESVVDKFSKACCIIIDKKVEEKLDPIREMNQKTLKKVSDVAHMLKNKDHGEAGAFDLILEELRDLKNEK